MIKIFSLGSITYKLLYPLFLSFFCFGNSIVSEYFLEKNYKVEFYIIFAFTVRTFSHLLFGIIMLIQNRFCSKSNKIKETELNKKKLIICLFIIFCATLGEAVSAYYAEPLPNEKIGYSFLPLFKVLQVIVTMIICIFLFKNQLYRHHYISGGFSIFLVIIMTIIECIYNTDGYNIGIILLYLLGYIFYCVEEIQEKWIMHFLLVQPFSLCFFKGLFLLGFFVITLIIIFACSFEVFSFSQFWENIGWFFYFCFPK